MTKTIYNFLNKHKWETLWLVWIHSLLAYIIISKETYDIFALSISFLSGYLLCQFWMGKVIDSLHAIIDKYSAMTTNLMRGAFRTLISKAKEHDNKSDSK